MFRSSFQIAKVWGIPIKVHLILVLLLPFFAIDYGLAKSLIIGIGLFTSIALHELGHSLVAIKKGCRVREILLMPLGGIAQMESIPTRPVDEFLMAIAGPAVSIVLGVSGILAGGWLAGLGSRFWADVVFILGVINCGLAVFNMLPSFPMDGGRVLRAVLTPKMGRLKATFIASRLGRIMAFFFGFFGLYHGRLMLVFIAFFIFIAAGNEYRMVQMQEARKRQRTGGWPPSGFSGFEPPSWSNPVEPEDDDSVVISPPPYERGPDERTDVRVDNSRNPFSNLFRR